MVKSNFLFKNSTNIFIAFLLSLVIFSSLYNFSCKCLFEGMTNGKELVLIHMNGCGHCDKLMPEWDLATKENTSDIKMRKVERNEQDGPNLCKKHNVQGFPTILLLENGNKIDEYNGERNKKGLLDFLNIY